MKKTLFGLRKNISKIDKKILFLFGERFKKTSKIGKIKEQLGIGILDEKQKNKKIKEFLKIGLKQGLSEEFILGLFEYIHEYSCKSQKK